MPSPEPTPPPYDVAVGVVIVGAGFGGCYALHEMRRQGYTAKILKAGSDFGGVWHFNRYPGVRVDSESPLYQLSLSSVTDSFNFTERFPDGEELRRYFAHLDKTLDLRKTPSSILESLVFTLMKQKLHGLSPQSQDCALPPDTSSSRPGRPTRPSFPVSPASNGPTEP